MKLFIGEGLVCFMINGIIARDQKVLDVDVLFLPQTVRTPFALGHNRWRPMEFCKDNTRRSGQCETFSASSNRKNSDATLRIILKLLDQCSSTTLGCFATNANKRSSFRLECFGYDLLKHIQHLSMMRKHQKLLSLRTVDDLGNERSGGLLLDTACFQEYFLQFFIIQRIQFLIDHYIPEFFDILNHRKIQIDRRTKFVGHLRQNISL